MNEGEGKKPEVEPGFTELLFREALPSGSEMYLFRASLVRCDIRGV